MKPPFWFLFLRNDKHLLLYDLQLILVFSWFYVRYYQDHAQSEVSTTLTAILALSVCLLTVALVPVDIFLVSYMKNDDGSWKVCKTYENENH